MECIFLNPLEAVTDKTIGKRKALSLLSIFVSYSNIGGSYLQLLFVGPVLFLQQLHVFWCWFLSVIRLQRLLKFSHGFSWLEQITSIKMKWIRPTLYDTAYFMGKEFIITDVNQSFFGVELLTNLIKDCTGLTEQRSVIAPMEHEFQKCRFMLCITQQ